MAVSFLRGEEPAVSAVEAAVKSSDSVGISTVSMIELLHPIYHRKMERQEKEVKAFFHRLRVLPLDDSAAAESAKIMGGLLRIGEAVNALDVMIAGTAVANGADRMLTSDRDFESIAKVSQLKVEVLR